MHGPPERRTSVPVALSGPAPAGSVDAREPTAAAPPRPGTGPARDDGEVKTRTLLILALVTGLAIVAAGAIQIFLAR